MVVGSFSVGVSSVLPVLNKYPQQSVSHRITFLISILVFSHQLTKNVLPGKNFIYVKSLDLTMFTVVKLCSRNGETMTFENVISVKEKIEDGMITVKYKSFSQPVTEQFDSNVWRIVEVRPEQ